MSYIINEMWGRQEINSYKDMALMYQLDMNGHSKPMFQNVREKTNDEHLMPELLDRHFGQKGVLTMGRRVR